jgi:hypothetical protein
MEIRELSEERLVFERHYPPSTGKTDAHLHLDFAQSWEILSGTATVGVDGETRRVGPGETVEVEAPTKHQDPYNEAADALAIRWEIQPATEFIHGYINGYCHLLARDELDAQDEFPMLQLLVILRATDARSYLANVPIAVQRLGLPLLAGIGRMRGYRPSYAPGPAPPGA